MRINIAFYEGIELYLLVVLDGLLLVVELFLIRLSNGDHKLGCDRKPPQANVTSDSLLLAQD